MIRSAIITPCGLYRISLSRIWDASLPVMALGMLNPSFGDAENDDPTIRRSIGFAKREGCGSLTIVNMSPLRSSEPDAIVDHLMTTDILHWNFEAKRSAFRSAWKSSGKAVVAFGAHPYAAKVQPSFMAGLIDLRREMVVSRQLKGRMEDYPIYCLGRTAKGMPRHPLYLRNDQPLEVYA